MFATDSETLEFTQALARYGLSPQKVIEMAKSLPPQKAKALDRLLVHSSIWRQDLVDGHGNPIPAPPDFDTFIRSEAFLGLPPLTPRQEKFLRSGIDFRPDRVFRHEKELTTLVACYGKGCLASGTMLTDWRSGEARTVEEWEKDGRCLYLPSWNGEKVVICKTSPVYQKGVDQLFRVTLRDGRSFVSTAKHRCLTKQGWRKVGAITPLEHKILVQPLEMDRRAAGEGDWVEVAAILPGGEGAFYDLNSPEHHNYFDTCGICHHNSGKDYISSIVLSWLAFVVNSLREPWAYLGMAPGEPMDMVNVAVNASQAESVFFAKLKARLKRPCFAQFINPANIGKNIVKFLRTVPGQPEPNLLLQLHSLHAENESWEGKSVLAWVMDEADAFEDSGGNSNAEACYNTLVSSAGSRFKSRWLGIVISFRRVQDGFMDKLHARSLKSGKAMRWDEATTFEVLPWRHKTDPDMQEHYDRDPVDAACKYENRAPAAVDAFITMPHRIDNCIEHNRSPVADVFETVTSLKNQQTGKSQDYIALRIENVKTDKDRYYFIHGDPGVSDCSFGLSMCYIENQRAVARGKDMDADDRYDGDVLRDDTGLPRSGVTVAYYDAANQKAATTRTDREGRHQVWLKPGVYTYVFLDQLGTIRVERDYRIAQTGVEMQIETGVDAQGNALVSRQVVYPIVEALVLEWRPRDDMPVDFQNVGQIIKQLCNDFSVYQVTFDRWNSVSMVQDLLNSGINAQDLTFGNPMQMAMYKNLRTLIYGGLVSLLGDCNDNTGAAQRANYQIRRVRNIRNIKVDKSESEYKDLADARAASTYYATMLSGTLSVAQNFTIPTMATVGSGGQTRVGQFAAFSSEGDAVEAMGRGVSPENRNVPYW